MFVVTNRKEKTMLPHQERVVEEKAALDEKIGKLFVFITGEKFKTTVSLEEQQRLKLQCNLMTAYSMVLGMRIDAF